MYRSSLIWFLFLISLRMSMTFCSQLRIKFNSLSGSMLSFSNCLGLSKSFLMPLVQTIVSIKTTELPLSDFWVTRFLFLLNLRRDSNSSCVRLLDHKIIKLIKNSLSIKNSDTVIYSFSSVNLSDSDKSLLSKGLNSTFPPASLEYSEYLVELNCFSGTHLV